jgi:murein DD-endopeptidase MepM/ murein hydrolase activator NlpD
MNFLSKFFIKFFSVIALLLVFGCGQKPAKIVNRSKVLYNKTNQFNLDKYQNYSKKTSKKNSQKILNEENKELNLSENNHGNKISPNQDSDDLSSNHKSKKNLSKNIETNSHNSQEDSTKNPKDQQNLKNSKEAIAKEIIIENSDQTIYDIAKKHQISIREIIDFNNLKAPYKLKKGDHILIPKAQFHIVKKGETLFSISRLYNMKIEEIISANSLIKPYGIKVGNKLQIANLTISNSPNKIKNNSQNSGEKNHENDNSSPKNIAQNNPENNPENSSENYPKNSSENSSENSTKNNSQNLANPSKPNSNSSNKNLLAQEKSQNNFANNSANNSTDNNSTNNNSTDNGSDNDQSDDKKNIFSWPVRGAVISKFGPKKGGLYNDGINIKAREGASVGSAEDGVVAYVGNELKGYGNLVIIKHSQGWITAYAHLKEFNVKRGQKILKSQKIGLVGSTGSVSFPQLYFGLRKGREALNPQNYLKSTN